MDEALVKLVLSKSETQRLLSIALLGAAAACVLFLAFIFSPLQPMDGKVFTGLAILTSFAIFGLLWQSYILYQRSIALKNQIQELRKPPPPSKFILN